MIDLIMIIVMVMVFIITKPKAKYLEMNNMSVQVLKYYDYICHWL